jgi:hypothetical protein
MLSQLLLAQLLVVFNWKFLLLYYWMLLNGFESDWIQRLWLYQFTHANEREFSKIR